MESLSSKITAQKLIERIRLEHCPQIGSKLSSIIKNALDILSAELYDTSTHFLREFLQNADDNNYDPGVVPWLQLSYDAGFLRVDCNELGFTAENVEAICTIRNSTKSGQSHMDRTGEKGIGFKSVFKIADVVWISSREYAFKFDKNVDFGTIAPIWEEFPRPVLGNHTSYLLQLNEGSDEGQTFDSLRNFDHTYLLFLRRLRRVTLNVGTNATLETTEIRRWDEIQKSGPVTIVEVGEKTFTYIIVKEQVYDLPQEAKRVGIESSELILAFPECDATENHPQTASEKEQKKAPCASPQGHSENKPERASEERFPSEMPLKGQNVHAILPIGQYGLKFIVQADFLQTANRRHIDTSSAWNIVLRNAIPKAFIASVSRLNSGLMRFSWPGFIPSTEIDPFFEPIRREIMKRLKDLPILESCTGELTAPSKLTYLDTWFFDHAGEPLCLWKQSKSTYLSRKYPRHLRGILLSLGVEEFTDKMFVEHLQQMILEDEKRFRVKSDEWHAELARALLPLVEDVDLKRALRSLPIVPLSNGEWVPATSEPRIFQEQSVLGDLHVLDSLRIIHPAAMSNAYRRNLWSSLDICTIDTQGICKYIVDAHENPVVDPKVWDRAQLIAHAKFLYNSKWRPPKAVDIWVQNRDGEHVRSSAVYYLSLTVDDERTRRVFDEMTARFDCLHDDYFVSTAADTTAEVEMERGLAKINKDYAGSASPKRIHYLEDIADAQKVAYPISEEHFQDFLEWRQEFLEWRSQRREWDHLLQEKRRYDESITSNDEDEWLSFLKDVLQVATLPRLARVLSFPEDPGLPEIHHDIEFLFEDCDASDVLHVLVSNWHNYAHLIERQGTDDQREEEKLQGDQDTVEHYASEAASSDEASSSDEYDFPAGPRQVAQSSEPLTDSSMRSSDILEPGNAGGESSSQSSLSNRNALLVAKLRDVQVNTSKGEVPLSSCVLPNLDPRFDEDADIRLPTLDLSKDSPEVRQRLRYFLISVEADAEFYLKCVEALKRIPSPPYDTLRRLYEEVQYRYDDNAASILHKFSVHSLVYLPHRALGDGANEGLWMSISESMANGIDPVLEYPSCDHLFRSLCDPTRLHTTEIEAMANWIQASHAQSADFVLESLGKLSLRFKGVPPRKAAEMAKSLKKRRIFPVWDTMDAISERKFNRMVSPNEPNWYIDDTNEFRRCFGGRIPLLIATPSAISELTDLLSALNLGSRKLSKIATRRSSPTGRQMFLAGATAFWRSRFCFLRPLIPKHHSKSRDSISVQLQNISAFSATKILETFNLTTDEADLMVRGPAVPACATEEGGPLRLFFTESALSSLTKSWHWVHLLARHMEIDDTISFDLLATALTNRNTDQVYQQFQARGYDIKYTPSKSLGTVKGMYLSMSGNVAPMLSRFDPFTNMKWKARSMVQGIQPHSRKIPLVQLVHASGAPGNIGGSDFFEQRSGLTDPLPDFRGYLVERDPDSHERYIAEAMISQLFQERLGELYDPVKCWTSSLRSRSGLPDYTSDGAASFTMRGQGLSKAILKLLIQSSYRNAALFSRESLSINAVYHFEILITANDSNDWFPLPASTLEKARVCSDLRSVQKDGKGCAQLVVWVRIYFAFTSPRFEFIVDPWLYYVGGGLILQDIQEGQIPLSDNKAEDSSLKQTHQRVDDLANDKNKLGPSLTMLNRKSMESTTSKAIVGSGNAEDLASGLTYRYRKLEEEHMRLFVLFRGEQGDILRGIICHMPFNDAGAFRALSYVWGPDQPNQKKRFLVTPQGVLRIRTSLGAALQRLRQKTKELVLWIDAICINQEDQDEKVQQILLLPQIFQRATSTLAIIATDEEGEQTVQTLLQIAAVQIYGPDISKWPEKLGLLRDCPDQIMNGLPGNESPFWQDVAHLFRRPWFSRAWIVQEAIAARTVTLICGKWMFDWIVLHTAMEVVDRELGMNPFAHAWKPFMTLTEHREWEARSRRWPLLHLLETFRYVKAGLQRDRFFSLLGLAADADNPLFEPDYRSPFEQIVRRFAQAFVEQGGGLRLLCLAGPGNAGQENESHPARFPSWVPDWTREPKNHSPLSSAIGRGVVFSASGRLKPAVRFNQTLDVLEVAGVLLVEKVMWVSRYCNEASQRSRYFAELDNMIEACELIPPAHRQRLKESVPVAGALHPESGVSCPINITESYVAYRKVLKKDGLRTKSMREKGKAKTKEALPRDGWARSEEEDIPTGFRERSKTYEALLDAYILGWRFVVTDAGQCGIAPKAVLPGDLVAIVSGGNVPFIMREALGQSVDLYNLVGECYIDGMMFGEAIQGYEPNSVIPNWLSLK